MRNKILICAMLITLLVILTACVGGCKHSYTCSVMVEPGCETAGEYTYSCTQCGHSYTEQIVATGHDFYENIVAPDVSKEGYTEYICLNCGHNYHENIAHPLGTSGLEYSLKGDGTYAVIGSTNCTDAKIYIPQYYNDLPVTEISESAFAGNEAIVSVELADTISKIGNLAFFSCSSLKEFKTSKSSELKYVSSNAFLGCTLENFIIPSTVRDVDFIPALSEYNEYDNGYYVGSEDNPFLVFVKASSDNITSCQINANTEFIAPRAFQSCSSLETLVIPQSVKYIGISAIPTNAPLVYNEYDGGKYLGSSEHPYTVLCGMSNATTDYFEIHEDTKIICSDAVKLRSNASDLVVDLPEGITCLQTDFFSGGILNIQSLEGWCGIYFSDKDCNSMRRSRVYIDGAPITKLVIPDTVTEISRYAFCFCTATELVIPNSVVEIGERAFSNCSFDSVSLGTGLNTVRSEAFFGNTIKSLNISDVGAFCEDIAFEGIGSNPLTFAETLLVDGEEITTITIPEGTKKIQADAFYSPTPLTGVSEIKIPSSVIYIGDNAFRGMTGVSEIKIPSSVIYIGVSAFRGMTGVTKLEIGNGVTHIGDYSFEGLTGITEISIPGSLEYLGERAFYNCTSVTSINLDNKALGYMGYSAFSSTSHGYEINITDIDSWLNMDYYGPSPLLYASGWYLNGELITEVTFPEGTTRVKPYVLSHAPITKVTLPATVTEIGEHAFANSALTTIEFHEGIVEIGEGAFLDCNYLQDVHLPASLNKIQLHAFSGCDSAIFTVDESNEIYHSAGNCIILTEEKILLYGTADSIIPSDGSVQIIDLGAFSDLFTLTEITIPEAVEFIAIGAFLDSRNLIRLNVIGDNDFYLVESFVKYYDGMPVIVHRQGELFDNSIEKIQLIAMASNPSALCSNFEKVYEYVSIWESHYDDLWESHYDDL